MLPFTVSGLHQADHPQVGYRLRERQVEEAGGGEAGARRRSRHRSLPQEVRTLQVGEDGEDERFELPVSVVDSDCWFGANKVGGGRIRSFRLVVGLSIYYRGATVVSTERRFTLLRHT